MYKIYYHEYKAFKYAPIHFDDVEISPDATIETCSPEIDALFNVAGSANMIYGDKNDVPDVHIKIISAVDKKIIYLGTDKAYFHGNEIAIDNSVIQAARNFIIEKSGSDHNQPK